MRNYDEDTLKIAERIFEKGDSILAERNRRTVRIKRVSLTISMLCASVLICFGAWSLTKNTDLMKKPDADITVIDTVPDTTKSTTSAIVTTHTDTTVTTYTTSEQVKQTDESTAMQTTLISTTAVKTTVSAVTSRVSTAVSSTTASVTTETSDEEISVPVITTENTQETAVITQSNTTASSRPVTTSAAIMPVTSTKATSSNFVAPIVTSVPMTNEIIPVTTTTTTPLSVVITTKADAPIEETSPVDTPENTSPSLPESIVINGIVYGYYGFMGSGYFEFLQSYYVGNYEYHIYTIKGLPEQLAVAVDWEDGLHMYYNYTYEK